MSMSLLELEKWASGDDDSPLQEEELVEDEIPADLTAVPLYERETPYTRRQFRWYPYGSRDHEIRLRYSGYAPPPFWCPV